MGIFGRAARPASTQPWRPPQPAKESARGGVALPADPELSRVVILLRSFGAVVGTSNSQIRGALRDIAMAGDSPSYPEYIETLIAGTPSRTDTMWEWLLRLAHRAHEQREIDVVALIGHFVEFSHQFASFDSPIDIADMRVWPMSPGLLGPFADVVLPAVAHLPNDWKLYDGTGEFVDRDGLLLLWSLAEEEMSGVSRAASFVSEEFRRQRQLSALRAPGTATLTRRVRASASKRSQVEAADRVRGFAGCREYSEGLVALARDDMTAALPALLAAARQGHDDAAYRGGPAASSLADSAAALELWGQAARAGYADAATAFGFALHDLNSVSEAREWFERAGRSGDARGYAVLTSLDMDEPAGRRKWANLGAQAGDPYCMGELAACLFQDAQRPYGGPDAALLAQARRWGERGGSLGDPGAMFFAGAIAALEGDRRAAKDWLVKAHRSGHTEALDFIGEFGL